MAAGQSATGPVRFGVYELDARLGVLRKDGVKIRLQDQPLQILILLLDRPGDIVTREEIRHKLWPNGTFVDFDHSLNSAVMRLREALDDTADNPRFIATVPRRGYRFLATSQPATNNAASPAITPPASRRKLWAAGAAIVAMLTLIAALNVAGLRDRLFTSADTTSQIRSIAVLPLKNLTNDPEQDYFVEGIHQALVDELSKISALRVISRNSTLRFRQSHKPLPQIARELNNVGSIVTGSVLREGNQVRISVQLILASSDRQVWSQSFDRELRNILALHSDVARAIATQVKATLTSDDQVRLARTPTVDPKAYEAYLRGQRYYWSGSLEDHETAIRYFSQALEIDPSYAPAYSGLALVHGEKAWFSKSATAEALESERARASALKALVLDDTLAEAHAILGGLRLREWEWADAEARIQRADELNSGSFSVHVVQLQHLMVMARFKEGLRRCRDHAEVDPFSPVNLNWCGMAYYNLGDYDRALQQWQASASLVPKYFPPHGWQAFVYLQKGMSQQAIAAARSVEELGGDAMESLALAAHIFARADAREDAQRLQGRVEELSKQHPPTGSVWKAVVHAGLGEKDKAFTSLERAFTQHSAQLFQLQFFPGFEPLRDDPRYKQLLRRMNFPD